VGMNFEKIACIGLTSTIETLRTAMLEQVGTNAEKKCTGRSGSVLSLSLNITSSLLIIPLACNKCMGTTGSTKTMSSIAWGKS